MLDRDTCSRVLSSRGGELVRPLVADPLVEQLWPTAIERMQSGANWANASPRPGIGSKASGGVETLELPQSRLGQFEAYHWFVRTGRSFTSAVGSSQRGAAEYTAASIGCVRPSDSRSEYRRPLARTPLWVWTASDPERRRCSFSSRGTASCCRTAAPADQPRLTPEGRASGGRTIGRARRRRRQDSHAGAADHDVCPVVPGGLVRARHRCAKYDQVTDVIMHRFLGLPHRSSSPCRPRFSCLCRVKRPTLEDQRRIALRIARVDYHPERYLDWTAELQRHRERTGPTRSSRSSAAILIPARILQRDQRHATIAAANAAMQRWVEPRRRELQRRRRRRRCDYRPKISYLRREYAFCLFPQTKFTEV